MMKYLLMVFVLLGFMGCSVPPRQDVSVVPLPTQMVLKSGSLKWKNNQSLVVAFDSALFENVANQWQGILGGDYGFTVSVAKIGEGAADVSLVYQAMENPERYELEVSSQGVTVKAGTAAAAFYALQTFKQLLPLKAELDGRGVAIRTLSIADEPAFSYRGTHLDVGRHFFTADSIKRFIDILAMHKMNTFHWHLTEDQGWRIEIKKYPRLTEVGSYRPNSVIGRNSGEYDNVPVSGFYTQDEIKDVVRYAAERYITIIPEVDMPGHMLAALAAYPELGCRGKNYEVCRQWGVFDEVLCAGNEKTYSFVFDVLDEVMQLFPSKYIHIGGDECPKAEWVKCPKCQAKIRQLKIKHDGKHSAEEQLQSYFTKTVEKYLNEHGRLLIGWDEIMEGGLSETATVMAWRGANYAFEAAALGNDAILTPGNYCYFDHYQTDDVAGEPLAIGGYTPIHRVYGYEPIENNVPDSIRKHILGVQANLWTEYMKTFSQVEYMLLPRLAALSEVNWSNAPKDYDGFLVRLERFVKQYDEKGYNYGRHIFNVNGQVVRDSVNSTMNMSLSALSGADIRYTIDGSEPTRSSAQYVSPVAIDHSMTFKAVAFYGDRSSSVFSQKFEFSLSTAKPITLNTLPNPTYSFNGGQLLNDGLVGTKIYRTGRWMGFLGNDVSATIDLLTATPVASVGLNALVITGDWIFRPSAIRVSASDDDQNYTLVKELLPEAPIAHVDAIESYRVDFETINARFIKVEVASVKKMPEWHSGKGRPAYVFVDEIVVY